MSDWAKWALGIVAFLICAGLIAVSRLIAGKANKLDVNKEIIDLRADNLVQATEGLRQYRELLSSIEGIKKEISALDKHSLTSLDLIEMKADIKELVKGIADSVKLIDGMPERLTSLERTRNKQSER